MGTALNISQSYWIIPNLLLVGQYPGGRNEPETIERLHSLYLRGIHNFIDLTLEGELTSQGMPLVPYQFLLKQGVHYIRCPIEDRGVPSRSEMKKILDHIDASISLAQPLYLHCRGGKYRTATVVGCYLARHSVSYGANMSQVELATRINSHARDVTLTDSQRKLVESWGVNE
jgi:Inositol hexakisphosphate